MAGVGDGVVGAGANVVRISHGTVADGQICRDIGADVSWRNNAGMIASDAAEGGGHHSGVTEIGLVDLVKDEAARNKIEEPERETGEGDGAERGEELADAGKEAAGEPGTQGTPDCVKKPSGN